MPKQQVDGTHQRVTPAGAAWIERQMMEFRCVHHRDPEGGELIALVLPWRILEADTARRRSIRRQHVQECACGNYQHPRHAAPRTK